MEDGRPNPDDLLHEIKSAENDRQRGRLKIFFGYAAGVGKTYAMLEAAQIAKRQGVDIVCGYIEPHTRPETMELRNGLETLPTLAIPHKDMLLREMDLDGVLQRKPQLVLVDELAHTNAAGCRHGKRYMDVQELLNSGINVYTTVNVQHIESLCDIVASITGIIVRERIPDKIFDSADQVELVDIEPKDLIERLREGKIYKPRQAQQALTHFFTEEKLTALREIALRRTADRVNRIAERKKRTAGGEYFTEENILVGLSSSPSNAKIIRAAARMAGAFQGSFTALFVETPAFMGMPDADKNRLRANMRLAQQLGARIDTVYGEDIAFQIAEYARVSGVSKIVVGRSSAKRRFVFYKSTFSERLTAYAPNLDIYIIPDNTVTAIPRRYLHQKKERILPRDVLVSILCLLAATLVSFGFYALDFSEANIITVYIFGVLVTAVATSHRFFSLCSSVLSVLAFNFFFTEPRLTLNAYGSGYPVTFVIMFAAAFLTSSLALKLKRQAWRSAQTAYRTRVLLDTNQLLQQEKDLRGIARITAEQLVKLLRRDVVFYPAEEGRLAEPFVLPAREGEDRSALYLSENEKAVAAWVFQNNKRAGASTATLGSARCLYFAVRSGATVYGVVGIALQPGEALDTFESDLLLSILTECALAVEKELFRQKREEAQAQAKNEQLRANLLRSISHDLRTPLTSISGNAGVLLSNNVSEETRKQIYTDIYDDAAWLINLVENLLSVTRIEDGSMHIHRQAELLDELVTEALGHVNRLSVEHEIRVALEDDLQLVKVDARLIMQVIVNMVDNAIKYTPPGSQIVISSRRVRNMVEVSVADDGEGIPNTAKARIFEMFYTAGNQAADAKRGLGLGLALCKSIITAHGGEIEVGDHVPHGTVFRFTLPAEEVALHEP